MKAILLQRYGGKDGFQVEEIPVPKVCPGYVLVKVCSSSVNPVDCKIRNGLLSGIGPDLPAVLHGDVAGFVAEVGKGVSDFAVGDEVYGCVGGFQGLDGVLAEFALADAKLLAKKPKTLSMAEAAVMPLVSITAWNALIDRGKVNGGQKVLIHGGTGGVGHIGLQLAKAMNAETHVTVSNLQKAKTASELGADQVIQYPLSQPRQYVEDHTSGEGYDLVFDTVGGSCLDQSLEAAKAYGTVVSIATRSSHDLTQVHVKSLTLHAVFMLLPLLNDQGRENHGKILSEIAKLVDQSKVRPLIHSQKFSFEDVGHAHDLWESGKIMGKILLENTW